MCWGNPVMRSAAGNCNSTGYHHVEKFTPIPKEDNQAGTPNRRGSKQLDRECEGFGLPFVVDEFQVT
jgi:hypothetical protein